MSDQDQRILVLRRRAVFWRRGMLDLPVGQVRGRAVVRRVSEHHGMGIQTIGIEQEDRARLHRQLRVLTNGTKSSEA